MPNPDLQGAHAASRRLLDAAVLSSNETIRDAVQLALADALDSLDGPDPRARAARAAQRVGDALAGAVAQSRGAARQASASAFRAEFTSAGGDAGDLPDATGGDAEDEQRGEAVGGTFAEAWLAAFDAAYANGGDPRAAAQRALDDAADRIPRIAATEAAHAFAAERLGVAAALARELAERGEPAPTMVWVCEDGGDCLSCFAMCGTTRPFGEPWTIGEKPFVEELWPGQVHPNCRCSLHVADVPAPRQTTEKSAPFWPSDLTGEVRRGRR